MHFNTDCYQFERSLYTLVCNDGVFDKPLLVSTAGYELGLTSYLLAQISLTGFLLFEKGYQSSDHKVPTGGGHILTHWEQKNESEFLFCVTKSPYQLPFTAHFLTPFSAMRKKIANDFFSWWDLCVDLNHDYQFGGNRQVRTKTV